MTGTTTPKGLPQTPPASTRKGHGTKNIPKFQLPDKTPTAQSTGHVMLQTPATARGKSIFSTPNTDLSVGHGAALFPPSPDYTPQRSPRSKRKKINFESFLPSTDSASVLLPNRGSVGSGRKHSDTVQPLMKGPLSLEPAELFKINKNLGFEQDAPESPTKRGRPPKHLLSTPGKQLITEEQVRSWHASSFKAGFSSDEDDEAVSRDSAQLANPFLDSHDSRNVAGSRKSNPFGAGASKVDYGTHLELINHRTGERKVELLSEEQRKFKPKKLNFSGI